MKQRKTISIVFLILFFSCSQSRKQAMQKDVEALANIQCSIEALMPKVQSGDGKAIEMVQQKANEKEILQKAIYEKYNDLKPEVEALLENAKFHCK
jgi:uncharacterized membrane protein affecting hemolysin expression